MLFSPTEYERVDILLARGNDWKYYRFSRAKPLLVEAEGTTQLTVRVRLLFDQAMMGEQAFALKVEEVGILGLLHEVANFSFTVAKSEVSTLPGDPEHVPSSAREFKLTVPDGQHRYRFTLGASAASAAMVRILIPQEDLKRVGALAPGSDLLLSSADPQRGGWGPSGGPGGDGSLMEVERARLRWSGRVGTEIDYEDNVFRYSDQRRKEFDPTLPRFRGLDSLDDSVLRVSARAECRLDKSRVGLTVEPRLYESNGVKDYQVYTLSFEQELRRDLSLAASYERIPNFFLLPLADPPNQSATFAPADFSSDGLEVALESTVSPEVSAEIAAWYKKRDFNSAFDERDSTIGGASIKGVFRLRPRLLLVTEAEYEEARAEGRGNPSLNSDVSYEEWLATLRPVVDLTERWRINVEISYVARDYTSELPEDSSHFGREDQTWIASGRLTAEIRRDLDLYVGFERMDRSSNRQSADLEFAQFTNDRSRLGLAWRF